MNFARARWAVAAGACAAWTGVIAWLAWTTANPVVVSAPQALVAEALLRCRRGEAEWTVIDVGWRRPGVAAETLPKSLPAEAAAPPPSANGEWLVPAVRQAGKWEIARIPAESANVLMAGLPRQPVYPNMPAVVRQFDTLLAPPQMAR